MLTDEQLEMRRTGIGGSDVAAILGLSKYKSPLSIYLDKLKLSQPSHTNINMEFGNDLEPFILSKYAEMEKVSLRTDIPMQRHCEYPFLLANIDGLRDDGIIVEAKNVGMYGDKGKYNGRAWGQPGTCEIPEAYHLQVAHYCMVMNLNTAHVVPYFGGSDLRIYVYERNERLEHMIMKKCISFWNDHVLAKAPPMDKVSMSDLNCLWRELDPDSVVVANESVEKLVHELRAVRSKQKELKDLEETLKTGICSFIEDKTTLTALDGSKLASWREEKRSSVNVDEMRDFYPEAVASFTRVKSIRVFRLNGDKS